VIEIRVQRLLLLLLYFILFNPNKQSMKRKIVIPLLLMMVISYSLSAQHTPRQATTAGWYWEYLPPGYNDIANANKKYPVIIFLHGLGKVANCVTPPCTPQGLLQSVLQEGLPKEINQGATMCFTVNNQEECFIVLSPQLKNGNSYSDWSTACTEKYMKAFLANPSYRIDKSRVYLTGLSLGARGIYNYVMTTRHFADSLAAIAPIAGQAGGSTANACNVASNKIAVWSVHGRDDTTFPVSADSIMIRKIRNCVPAPSPSPRFTIIETMGHNVWDVSYKTDNTLMSYKMDDNTYPTENLYVWFLKRSRNPAPIVNAGTDQTIQLPTDVVTLNATASDPNGTIVSYAWTKLSGGTATLSGANTASLTVSALQVGTYQFQIAVTDNGGATTSDIVQVTVVPSNFAPVVDAGTDASITLPTNTVTLTGSAVDSDGVIATYQWIKISGGTATLSGDQTASLVVSQLQAGNYVFQLTATDDDGASTSDQVSVTVLSGTPASWLEMTTNNAAGKSVALYYNALKSHAAQQTVRAGGNDYLNVYLKLISGTPNWNSLKIELTVSYQTRSLNVGTYASSIGSSWTAVQIPLDDFGHDAGRWTTGLSVVNFKVVSGFGNATFGVDEIRFTGGTTPFAWYGDNYETSGTAACVTESSTAFVISNRFTSGGATASARMATHTELEATDEISIGDIVWFYDQNGALLKKVGVMNAEDQRSLFDHVLPAGFYIIKVQSTQKVFTMKVVKR
jgi:hypothetical protein